MQMGLVGIDLIFDCFDWLRLTKSLIAFIGFLMKMGLVEIDPIFDWFLNGNGIG